MLLTKVSANEPRYVANINGVERTFMIPIRDLGTIYTLMGSGFVMDYSESMAAAMGICWAGPGKTTTMSQGVRTTLKAYGHSVLNELLASGWGFIDILELGNELFILCQQSLPDMKRAEDLTVPLDPLVE